MDTPTITGLEQLRERLKSNRFTARYDVEGLVLLAPVVLIFIFVTVIPVFFGIWLSFHSGQGVATLEWVGGAQYMSLLNSKEFFDSILTGVVFSITAVLSQVILGTIIALALNNWTKFASVVRAVIFAPYMIPTVGVAVVFRLILNGQIGILNWFLVEIGVLNAYNGISWFGLEWAMTTVVGASVWRWTVFVVILVLARLQSIDQTLYEMARTNGASIFRQFMDITYPNIKSVLYLVVLLRSIWMFNKFDIIWLLTKGGPLGQTTTMPVLAYERAFGQFAFGSAAAITTVMFLMLTVFGIVYFSVFEPAGEVEVKR